MSEHQISKTEFEAKFNFNALGDDTEARVDRAEKLLTLFIESALNPYKKGVPHWHGDRYIHLHSPVRTDLVAAMDEFRAPDERVLQANTEPIAQEPSS